MRPAGGYAAPASGHGLSARCPTSVSEPADGDRSSQRVTSPHARCALHGWIASRRRVSDRPTGPRPRRVQVRRRRTRRVSGDALRGGTGTDADHSQSAAAGPGASRRGSHCCRRSGGASEGEGSRRPGRRKGAQQDVAGPAHSRTGHVRRRGPEPFGLGHSHPDRSRPSPSRLGRGMDLRCLRGTRAPTALQQRLAGRDRRRRGERVRAARAALSGRAAEP